MSRARLLSFINSAFISKETSAALRMLDDALEKNVTAMLESLNQSLEKNADTILMNDTYGNNYYGSASGLYWQRFIPLRPAADVITVTLREGVLR